MAGSTPTTRQIQITPKDILFEKVFIDTKYGYQYTLTKSQFMISNDTLYYNYTSGMAWDETIDFYGPNNTVYYTVYPYKSGFEGMSVSSKLGTTNASSYRKYTATDAFYEAMNEAYGLNKSKSSGGIRTKFNPMGGYKQEKQNLVLNVKNNSTVNQIYFTLEGDQTTINTNTTNSYTIKSGTTYNATVTVNVDTIATAITSINISCNEYSQNVSLTGTYSQSFTIPAAKSNVTITVNLAAYGCITGDTQILLGDGTIKSAKNVIEGDLLFTYNEDTKEFENNRVVSIMKNLKNDIIRINFTNKQFIELTSGHPVLTEKGWASYDNSKTRKENLYNNSTLYQLKPKDKCLSINNEYLEIDSIEILDSDLIEVYDFTIDKTHTFIGNNVILHNAITG